MTLTQEQVNVFCEMRDTLIDILHKVGVPPVTQVDVISQLTALSDLELVVNLLSNIGLARETPISGTATIAVAAPAFTSTFPVAAIGNYGILVDLLVESNNIGAAATILYDSVLVYTVPVVRSDRILLPNRWQVYMNNIAISFTNAAGPGAAIVNFHGKVVDMDGDLWKRIQAAMSANIGSLIP